MYQERVYREKIVNQQGLVSFNIIEFESDILVLAGKELKKEAKEFLISIRSQITDYISIRPEFHFSMRPIKYDREAPQIVKEMIKTSSLFNVGPMATVAGAVSQFLGSYLLNYTDEVIIENGGDLYIKTARKLKFNIYTQDEIFKDNLNLLIEESKPLGICTSSGKLGHSKSYGKSDAVVIKAKSAIIADAAATAYANKVKNSKDIKRVLLEAKRSRLVDGILVIIDGELGAWGEIEFF